MSNNVVGQTVPQNVEATTTVSDSQSTTDDDNVVVVIRTTTLVILLVLSLVGNALVVLSVAQSGKNRYNPFNAFILSMASYGLLECALTMSLATGFSIEKSWMFGDFLAGFNASFIQLQNVGVMLTIAAMSIDRYISVTRLTKYHTHSSVHHANYTVLYTWIHAFIFSLPLLFQNQMLGVTCRAFVERCLCGLVEGTAIAFTALMGILCYFIPIVLIIVFLSLLFDKSLKEQRRLKSLNTSEYASYCLQESLLLSEARCGKYVFMLFIVYLIFKAPYVLIDILTQLQETSVYEPILYGNVTVVVDGSKFYYQTALAWLMFCFSSMFPIITFIQFPDHWRRLRNWVACEHNTVSIANNRPRASINQRNLRHKQRRQRQRLNNGGYTSKKRHKKTASVGTAKSHRKAPSSVSSNITSEKVTVNRTSTGEVIFRVPVLYAATDGLHLVASENTLKSQSMETSSRRRNEVSSSNNNNNSITDLSSSTESNKHNLQSESKISQPSGDLADDIRPSSVVDKRVDVMGSHYCLQLDEDVMYINSDFDADDDTESELNESANSHTLIWPHKHQSSAISASMDDMLVHNPVNVWNSSSRMSNKRVHVDLSQQKRHSMQSDLISQDNQDIDIPHPHTPTPPPTDDDILFVSSQNVRSDLPDGFVDRSNSIKIKLPTIKSKNITTSFTKQFCPASQGSNISLREGLIPDSLEGGFMNDGYESTSAIYSRRGSDVSVVIKQANGHSNKVFPNHTRAFASESPIRPLQINLSKSELRDQHNSSSYHLNYANSVNDDTSRRSTSSSHKVVKVTPMSNNKKSQKAVTAASSKSKRIGTNLYNSMPVER